MGEVQGQDRIAPALGVADVFAVAHALIELANDQLEIIWMTADLSKYADLHIFAEQ